LHSKNSKSKNALSLQNIIIIIFLLFLAKLDKRQLNAFEGSSEF